jgi:hypothetical protein
MKPETIALFERPYQEVIDNILTAVVGGIVAEPIYFDVKSTAYRLAQPAVDVRAVVGVVRVTVDNVTSILRHTFLRDTDYAFSSETNAIVWLGAALPDDESTFYVDYVRRDTLSPISDINIGSVTRTISEAIGREIATVYQQIDLAYKAGFVDTATDASLDLVVSILGVTRKAKEYAAGLVTFFRDPAVIGSITIPQGTPMSTLKGEAHFVTAEERTLQRGQPRVDIPVRAGDDSKGQVGIVAIGAITTLATSIAGIARITNFDATVLGANDETDDQLRSRAKAMLQSVGKATIAALARAVHDERATLSAIRDPNSAGKSRSDNGTVVLLVDTKPERFIGVASAVQETRAAGVLATVVAKYVFVKLKLVVTIAAGLSGPGKVKLASQIIDAMQAYVDGLAAGVSLLAPDLVKAILAGVVEISDAKDLRFVDVVSWRADVGGSQTNPLVDALLIAFDSASAGDRAGTTDRSALHDAIANVLANDATPLFSEDRIPDRSLIRCVGAGERRASDVDIEARAFEVVAVVGGDATWSIALDVVASDIVIVER